MAPNHQRLSRQAPVEVVPGYVSGPNAAIEATRLGLEKVQDFESIILVEGITDQIAVETLALRQGRDLESEGVMVLPIGGAQAIRRFLQMLGPEGGAFDLAGFCDADAVDVFRHALIAAGIGSPESAADMAALGFYVCVEDLEDELIRSVGPEQALEVVEAEGELRAFHTFQKQPEWRGRQTGDQLRRFIASKASRGHRYAQLLMVAVDLHDAPQPIVSTLARV